MRAIIPLAAQTLAMGGLSACSTLKGAGVGAAGGAGVAAATGGSVKECAAVGGAGGTVVGTVVDD